MTPIINRFHANPEHKNRIMRIKADIFRNRILGISKDPNDRGPLCLVVNHNANITAKAI